jgi:hypothetical protein
MRRLVLIFLGLWPLMGCNGQQVTKSSSGGDLRFYYTDTEQSGMVVKIKVFGPTERPGSVGDWIKEVKPLPAEAIPVKAKSQDTLTVCVCMFNLCPQDLFIGSQPETFRVECGHG